MKSQGDTPIYFVLLLSQVAQSTLFDWLGPMGKSEQSKSSGTKERYHPLQRSHPHFSSEVCKLRRTYLIVAPVQAVGCKGQSGGGTCFLWFR